MSPKVLQIVYCHVYSDRSLPTFYMGTILHTFAKCDEMQEVE